MILSLSNVLNFRAKIDADYFPINDAMLSIKDRRMAYLVLDTGQWFDSQLVLIEVNLVNALSLKEKSIKLSNDKAAVERAPILKSDSPLATETLPPIMIGPSGNTIPPLMMATEMPDQSSRKDQPTRSIDSRFQRFSDIRGMDVFGKDGQLGHLEDLFISDHTYGIHALRVANSKTSPVRQRLVPIEKLQHMAEQQTHLVLDVTSSELADAPEFKSTEALHISDLEILHRHYQ